MLSLNFSNFFKMIQESVSPSSSEECNALIIEKITRFHEGLLYLGNTFYINEENTEEIIKISSYKKDEILRALISKKCINLINRCKNDYLYNQLIGFNGVVFLVCGYITSEQIIKFIEAGKDKQNLLAYSIARGNDCNSFCGIGSLLIKGILTIDKIFNLKSSDLLISIMSGAYKTSKGHNYYTDICISSLMKGEIYIDDQGDVFLKSHIAGVKDTKFRDAKHIEEYVLSYTFSCPIVSTPIL